MPQLFSIICSLTTSTLKVQRMLFDCKCIESLANDKEGLDAHRKGTICDVQYCQVVETASDEIVDVDVDGVVDVVVDVTGDVGVVEFEQ